MSSWIPIAVGGYAICLIAAWLLVWKWRRLSQQWQAIAESWEAIADARAIILGRQQAIITALQMICRQAGMAVTITEQADGVDLVVLPTDHRPEIRH